LTQPIFRTTPARSARRMWWQARDKSGVPMYSAKSTRCSGRPAGTTRRPHARSSAGRWPRRGSRSPRRATAPREAATPQSGRPTISPLSLRERVRVRAPFGRQKHEVVLGRPQSALNRCLARHRPPLRTPYPPPSALILPFPPSALILPFPPSSLDSHLSSLIFFPSWPKNKACNSPATC
jgi:hypothetical protein